MAFTSGEKQPASRMVSKYALIASVISGVSQRPFLLTRRSRIASGPMFWFAVIENWWNADHPGLFANAIGMYPFSVAAPQKATISSSVVGTVSPSWASRVLLAYIP